jgi:O-methyltransferase involved in polyketide biosynthesis
MTGEEKINFDGVEGTMLLPLWGRYTESKKENGLIKDRKCVEIVDRAGIDFKDFAEKQNPASRLAWVARAWNIDFELRGPAADSAGEITVVCLGCGLDTAFFRQDLPAVTAWYDVDLPRVIEARRSLIGEAPRCIAVAGSVLDPETYRGIRVRGRLVVIAAGLLYYFTETEVRRVFENIAALAASSSVPATVIIDYCSARGVDIANKAVVAGIPGARMIWSAEGEDDIRRLHPRICKAETYPVFEKIRPALAGADAKMAEMSDTLKIMSFAVIEIS